MGYLENTTKFRSGDIVRPIDIDWPGTVLKVVFVVGDGVCYETVHHLQSGPVIKTWKEDEIKRCEYDKTKKQVNKEAVKA